MENLFAEVLGAMGIHSPESQTIITLERGYNNAATMAADLRMRSDSNTPEIWGKYLEYAHEAERFGAAIVVMKREKLSSRHPFFGVLKMTDTQNRLGCQ